MLGTKVDTAHSKLQESSRPNRKSIRQKRERRKTGLMKKALEYSKMCGAGRVYMFSADASGFWGFVGAQLVSLPRYAYLFNS
jgi:hypothetical protein